MSDLPVICIPSYQRADLITALTLHYLHVQNYPNTRIFIFVASEAERANYVLQIPRHLYTQIITGVLGLKEQRKFISDYFPEGEIIVQLDDDVRRIKFLDPRARFLDLIRQGVAELQAGCGLFGVLPNSDLRRMQNRTTRHLTHILGSFFMCRNHKALVINTTEKEDFERSILYFKRYGAVSRFQGAGVDTAYTKNAGGLQTDPNRRASMMSGISYLMLNYRQFCKTVVKKKDNELDVILNWRAKTGDPQAP
jgi:hypothetical protein